MRHFCKAMVMQHAISIGLCLYFYNERLAPSEEQLKQFALS